MLTGQERDLESGLDHFLYRQYASTLGRWTTPDPVMATAYQPQSLNRYGYVMNNPSNLTDCKGLTFLPGPHCILVPVTVLLAGFSGFSFGGFNRPEGYYDYVCPLDPVEGDRFGDLIDGVVVGSFSKICDCVLLKGICLTGCVYGCVCSRGWVTVIYGEPKPSLFWKRCAPTTVWECFPGPRCNLKWPDSYCI